jgi:hypothetical protein
MTLCYVSGLKTARVACAFSMSRNRVSSKSGTPRMHEKSTHLITYGPGSKLTICSINVGFSQTAIPDALNSKLVSIVLIKLVYHHAEGSPWTADRSRVVLCAMEMLSGLELICVCIEILSNQRRNDVDFFRTMPWK